VFGQFLPLPMGGDETAYACVPVMKLHGPQSPLQSASVIGAPRNAVVVEGVKMDDGVAPVLITYIKEKNTTFRMDNLISDIQARKTGDKFFDFCMDDAIFHLTKVKEILECAEENPEGWFNGQREVAQLFVKFVHFSALCNLSSSSESFP
jgi:hypothetical protein